MWLESVLPRASLPHFRIEPTLSWYNLRMSKATLDQHSSVTLPPEALDALGIEAGAELEVEIVGRAVVVRSVEEARRSAEFISTFESILSKRRTAYKELAKGPDQ
jgi:antitoxin component of MazEF toxin-antitoxin module